MDQDQLATIRWEDVSAELIEQFPELREAYQAELQWWSEATPGAQVVYGDILNPHIDQLLQSEDGVGLRRVFAFPEQHSRSEDLRVQEIVAVTVCEYFIGDRKKFSRAKRFMGPATLKISDYVENA